MRILAFAAILFATTCLFAQATIVNVPFRVSDTHAVRVEITPDYTLEEIATMLQPLDPLRKTHYSWPLPVEKMAAVPELLSEYIRITGAASISARWGNSKLSIYELQLCELLRVKIACVVIVVLAPEACALL